MKGNRKIPQDVWDKMPQVGEMRANKIPIKEIALQLGITTELVKTLHQRYLNENPPEVRLFR